MLKPFRLASVLLSLAALVVSACGGDSAECDDNDCVVAPEPFCQGQALIGWEPNGTCDSNNMCAYEIGEVIDLCAEQCLAEGEVCETGPCTNVICEQPPADHCDGDLLIGHEAVGLCVEGACTYAELETDCADTDQICFNGACTDISCQHMVCDTPPEATCETDDSGNEIAVSYVARGQCADAVCSYPESEREDCTAAGGTCIDGACSNLCTGVSCIDAPADSCDGNTAIAYSVVGSCDTATGECAYESTETECGDLVCVDGMCQVSCDDVVCDAPPAGRCEADRAFYYEAGACASGECVYEEVMDDCGASGQECVDGACVGLCTDIVCDTPPAARSCEGDTAIYYDGVGVCDDETGFCEYTEVHEDCSTDGGSCVDGACVGACDTVSCIAPPASTCDGNMAHSYEVPGACAAGECSYTPTVEDCSESGLVCRLGVCEPFCTEGFTCEDGPEPHCDGNIVVTYQAIGECVDDGCTYPIFSTEDCEVGGGTCVDAACQYEVDPCEGIDCLASPRPYCDGNVGVTYLPAGVCVDGECEYTERRTDCTETGEECRTGYCYDACFGVTCNSPPASGCVADEIVNYSSPGSCSDGMCTYPEDRTDCAVTDETCYAGFCVDPCMLIGCNVPPAPECLGDIRRTYYGVGTCSAGECSGYPFTDYNCTLGGMVCSGGACVADPCDAIVCDDPPTDVSCDGDVLNYYDVGTCTDGACEYTMTHFDCSAYGRVCDPTLGECVFP